MADFHTAKTIDVGDLIIKMAISKVKTPKRIELIPIKVVGINSTADPVEDAIEKFNKTAKKYVMVIECKEKPIEISPAGKIKKYKITATALVEHN